MRILHSELIDSFKESLGTEGAEILIKNALAQAKINSKRGYTKEESLQICEALKASGGFIAIVAGILASRFLLR